jgi:hypothetical protein
MCRLSLVPLLHVTPDSFLGSLSKPDILCIALPGAPMLLLQERMALVLKQLESCC